VFHLTKKYPVAILAQVTGEKAKGGFRGMIYFLAVVTALSLFWSPVSFAGYKDIDPAIAEREIYSHIVKEEARFTFRLQKGGFEKGESG